MKDPGGIDQFHVMWINPCTTVAGSFPLSRKVEYHHINTNISAHHGLVDRESITAARVHSTSRCDPSTNVRTMVGVDDTSSMNQFKPHLPGVGGLVTGTDGGAGARDGGAVVVEVFAHGVATAGSGGASDVGAAE